MSRPIVAALVGSVVMLPLGYLLYGVVFADLFESMTGTAVMKDPPAVMWIVAGQLAFGVLLMLIIYWRGAKSFGGGLQTGAVLGFLMAIGYDFAQYGTTNLWTATATLTDPFITAVLVGVPGGVVGAILGWREKPT